MNPGKDSHLATHDICPECVTQYLQVKIGSGIAKIKCVDPECTVDISYFEIKQQVRSDNLFKAYKWTCVVLRVGTMNEFSGKQ